MDALTSFIDIQRDGVMYYNEFINLIDINGTPPQIMEVQGLPVAGLSTIRTDLPRPRVPPGQCKADLVCLGDETTAAAIINPSIFTNYALSHRDFFLPRQPEFLRKLFEKLGYAFPGDTFEQLWKTGLNLDKTGLVCVDTFKLLLKKSLPLPVFNTSEQNYCF